MKDLGISLGLLGTLMSACSGTCYPDDDIAVIVKTTIVRTRCEQLADLLGHEDVVETTVGDLMTREANACSYVSLFTDSEGVMVRTTILWNGEDEGMLAEYSQIRTNGCTIERRGAVWRK